MVSKKVSSIRWDEEMRQQLEERAWRERTSVSELIRSLVRRGLAQDRLAERQQPAPDPDEGEVRTTGPAKTRAQ
ncbi:MAG: hypothetical protein AB2A00_25830 [Myxococcota bacterium]